MAWNQDPHDYIQNQPITISWMGMQSDSHALLYHGWRLDVSETDDHYRGEKRIRVRAESPDGMAQGYGEAVISYQAVAHELKWAMHFGRDFVQIGLEFGREICIGHRSFESIGWEPLSSKRYREPFHRIESVKLFQKEEPNKIIIPQHSMSELMDMVLEKQEPIRQEYYKEKCTGIKKELELFSIK